MFFKDKAQGSGFIQESGSGFSSVAANSEAPTLPSKIAIEKNSKGVNFTVELRCKDGDEVNTLDRLHKIYVSMRETYKD